ncbi:MAG: hypothetical protein KBE23_12195 [Chloroflexi bacterium]|nr:hypothetical protein [Chloroflexota bacterium]MBP7043498.1 hypothetical protein [Chloroflexota bacterium]
MAHVTNGNNHLTQENPKQVSDMRFFARSVGLLAFLTGLIYLSVIGTDGIAAARSQQLPEAAILLFALVSVATASILCAWRWEAAGSMVALLSALGIAFLAYLTFPERQLFSAFAYSSPFLVTGILFFTCWRRNRNAA